MKEFLSRAHRPFVEKNVEDDPAAYAEFVAFGWRVVPLTIIAGRGVKGFDPEALREALEAADRPPPDR